MFHPLNSAFSVKFVIQSMFVHSWYCTTGPPPRSQCAHPWTKASDSQLRKWKLVWKMWWSPHSNVTSVYARSLKFGLWKRTLLAIFSVVAWFCWTFLSHQTINFLVYGNVRLLARQVSLAKTPTYGAGRKLFGCCARNGIQENPFGLKRGAFVLVALRDQRNKGTKVTPRGCHASCPKSEPEGQTSITKLNLDTERRSCCWE